MLKFKGSLTSGAIHRHPTGYSSDTLYVKGVAPAASAVEWIAADPPSRHISTAGSFLAFPSPTVAITGDNCGVVNVRNGTYSIICKMPNAYYTHDGRTLLPPHIVLRVWDGNRHIEDVKVDLGVMIPYKELTHSRQRTGPEFYEQALPEDAPVLSQQEIFQLRTVPHQKHEMPVRKYVENFWT